MQQSSDEQILKDLYYELAREMPVEHVGLQMYKDHLLLPKEWETFTKLTEDKGEYLLDCLQRSQEPGFMEKFCSVLDKIGAENLLKTISHHRDVITRAPSTRHGTVSEAHVKYWKEKYIRVEELLKQSKRLAQTHEDTLSDLAGRTNETMRSIVHLVQTQLRINKSDLQDIQSNNSESPAIIQQSNLSREAQRRISTTSSSLQPASSRDSLDLSASNSSTSILSTNSEGGTQQHYEAITDSSNLGGTVPMDRANYIKPFQQNMSDRSDRDSDGTQGVDPPIPATNNEDKDDDDDDRGSTHTITKSVSQHSLILHQLRPWLGDSPESHIQADEPEDLREFREVHQRITKKYRSPK